MVLKHLLVEEAGTARHGRNHLDAGGVGDKACFACDRRMVGFRGLCFKYQKRGGEKTVGLG